MSEVSPPQSLNAAAPTKEYDSLALELDMIEGGIQRAQSALYTLFGVVLPAVISVFVFTAKEQSSVSHEHLATIFVVIVTLSTVWANCVWIELFAYARFKYVVLMPELYRVSGRADAKNMQQFSGSRSLREWMPTIVLNSGILAFLVIVEVNFVKNLQAIIVCSAFLIGGIISAAAVIAEARRLQNDVKNGVGD